MSIPRASLVRELETIVSNLVVSIKAATKAIDLSYDEAARDSLRCASKLKVEKIISQSKASKVDRLMYASVTEVTAMLASLHTLNVGSHLPTEKIDIDKEIQRNFAAPKIDENA